jgi:ABC-type dipeptide/oligopeptide/nickel transport system ATPase component
MCRRGERLGQKCPARAISQIVHRPGKIIDRTITYHRRLPDDSVQSVDITSLHPRGAAIRNIRGNEIAMIFRSR